MSGSTQVEVLGTVAMESYWYRIFQEQ